MFIAWTCRLPKEVLRSPDGHGSDDEGESEGGVVDVFRSGTARRISPQPSQTSSASGSRELSGTTTENRRATPQGTRVAASSATCGLPLVADLPPPPLPPRPPPPPRGMRWTPFECLPCAAQTAAGLLQLERDGAEVEVLQRSNAQLRSASADAASEPWGPPLAEDSSAAGSGGGGQPRIDANAASSAAWKDRTGSNLVLQLTTHRLVLWETEPPPTRVARYLHLSLVLHASLEEPSSLGVFKSTRKILLNTHLGDLWLVLPAAQGPSDVARALQSALQRQEWLAADASRTAEGQAQRLTRHKVGVDAVLAKSQIKHKQAQALTDHALAAKDAEELIREATELAKMVRKYVATLERSSANAPSSTFADADNDTAETNDVDAQAQRELAQMLQDMGMTSALSKKDSHNYYETIARQLADLLLPKLPRVGGVMTLTDVYCLLNRARSAHLLSPEDLWQATQVLDSLNLGLSTRTFPSGLVVLQESKWTDESRAELLRDVCRNGIPPLEAARVLRTTPLLAQEQLHAAERMGYLARDEQPDGVRFYPNRFDEWQPAQMLE